MADGKHKTNYNPARLRISNRRRKADPTKNMFQGRRSTALMATKLVWMGIVIPRTSRPSCRQLRVTTLIDTSSGQWSMTVFELAATQLQIPYALLVLFHGVQY